jgi:hypothetical protein
LGGFQHQEIESAKPLSIGNLQRWLWYPKIPPHYLKRCFRDGEIYSSKVEECWSAEEGEESEEEEEENEGKWEKHATQDIPSAAEKCEKCGSRLDL